MAEINGQKVLLAGFQGEKGEKGADGAIAVVEHYYELSGKDSSSTDIFISLTFLSAQSTALNSFDAFISYLKAGGYTSSSRLKPVIGGAVFDYTLKGIQDEMLGMYYNASDNTIRTVGESGNFANEIVITAIVNLSVSGTAFVREVY